MAINFKVGLYSEFLWLMLCFFLEIGKLLSYVTKKTKNKYLNRLLFIPDTPEDVYPFFVCPFQPQIVFGQFSSITCFKIT